MSDKLEKILQAEGIESQKKEEPVVEHSLVPEERAKETAVSMLEKNLAFLATTDLQERLTTAEDKVQRLSYLVADLIDLITLDDSVVHALLKKGDNVQFEDIVGINKDIKAVVQTWNHDAKFWTLGKEYEAELKDLLGINKYNSKMKRVQNTRLKNAKKLNNRGGK